MPPTVIKLAAVGEHVYVLGIVQGKTMLDEDYLLLKFDNMGNLIWEQTYGGPGEYNDQPADMAFDQAGNIYVTGLSYQGEVGVQASSYWTIKYSPGGSQLWTAEHHHGEGHGYYATSVEVSGGLVYVAGKSVHIADPVGSSAEDYHSILYRASDGKEIWNHSWDSPEGCCSRNYPNDMTIDNGSNMIVVGRSEHPGYDFGTVRYKWDTVHVTPDSFYTVLKFDWARYYNGPRSDRDDALAVATDDEQNIYVTGESQGTVGFQDYATVKYDKEGNQIWVRRYDGFGHNRDVPTGIAVDGEGNIIVTGRAQGVKKKKADHFVTIKYNPDGDTLWTTAWWNHGGITSVPNVLRIDKDDNIIIAGGAEPFGGMFCRVLDKDGQLVWERSAKYEGEDIFAEAHGMDVDANGNIYVAGTNLGERNVLLIKYVKQ